MQLRRLLFITAATALGLAAWAKLDWDQQAAKRKAELAFFEGSNSFGQERYDDYAMYMLRAHELDSADAEIGAEWGQTTLMLLPNDSARSEKAYQAILNLYDAHKDNYITGLTAARIARNSSRYSDEAKIWESLDSVFPTYAQPLQELGQAYLLSYATGDSTGYDKALSAFNRLEAENGKSVQLSAQKIRAYMFKNDTASTISEIEALAQSNPNDCYTSFYVGSIYTYLNEPEKAMAYLDHAAELDSTIGAIYLTRAELYQAQGDTAMYDHEMNMALQSPNLEVDQKLDIMREYVGGMLNDSTKHEYLRGLFDKLELMHPGEPEVYNLYTNFLYAISDYAGAAEQAGYSVALDGESEPAWTILVQSSVMAEDTINAVNMGKEAMERFPDNLYFPMAVAQCLNAEDKLQEAIAIVDSVKIETVNNPKGVSRFLTFRGDLYTLNSDTIGALKLYDEAVNLDPDNYMALNNAAYFMSLLGIDLDKAERYSTTAVRGEPENPTYLDTYAWVFFRKKDYSMAKNYIDMTLNLYGMGEKADSAEAAPNPADEEELIEEVTENEEDMLNQTISSDVLEHAGDIYFMSGEPAKALDYWKQALELEPEREILQRKVKHKTYFYE